MHRCHGVRSMAESLFECTSGVALDGDRCQRRGGCRPARPSGECEFQLWRRPGRLWPCAPGCQAEHLAGEFWRGDEGDDASTPTAWAREDIETPRPAKKVRPVEVRPGVLNLCGRWRCGLFRCCSLLRCGDLLPRRWLALRHHRSSGVGVGGEDSEEASQVNARLHHQGAEALEKLLRRKHQRAGTPSHGLLEAVLELPIVPSREPLESQRPPGAVPALCGATSYADQSRHFLSELAVSLVRIIVDARRVARSRSGGRNFPGRSLGTFIAASVSSFSVGSDCR